MDESLFTDFISLIKLVPEINAEHAIEFMGGSESLYENVLKKIVGIMPSNIEQMDKSLSTGDALHEFAVKVHGVKSTLRQVGCLDLARNAEALEKAAKAGEMIYCKEHYNAFREDLLFFCERVNAAMSQSAGIGENPEAESESGCDINDFFDILIHVKTAAEEYDTISASELLVPLAKHRFGGNTDILIAKAMEALEMFKPKQAQEYIAELIKEAKHE